MGVGGLTAGTHSRAPSVFSQAFRHREGGLITTSFTNSNPEFDISLCRMHANVGGDGAGQRNTDIPSGHIAGQAAPFLAAAQPKARHQVVGAPSDLRGKQVWVLTE